MRRSVSSSNVVVYEIEPPRADSIQGSYIIVPEAEAASWDEAGAVPSSDAAPELLAVCREIAAKLVLPRLGRGAEREIRRRTDLALAWARKHYSSERGPFEDFALAVLRVAARRFRHQFSSRRLREELFDQELRDLCRESDDGLLEYLDLVRELLEKAHRFRRFREQREREEDLISDTITKIIEVVRLGARPFPFAKYERAGLTAFVTIHDEVRAAARRHRRLVLVGRPIDLPTGTFPSAEDALLDRERRALLEGLPRKLAAHLTRKQQHWLAAFQRAAEDDNRVLVGAAGELGVHRSQATRAADRIAATARRFRLLDGLELE
jgi:hypothetical protein